LGGVSIQTCVRISRGFKAKLLEEEYAGGNFKIEVSSPGIDRPLTDEGDFRRKTGRMITLWHRDNGIESPIEGIIKLVSNGILFLETTEEVIEISIENVDTAKMLVAIK